MRLKSAEKPCLPQPTVEEVSLFQDKMSIESGEPQKVL